MKRHLMVAICVVALVGCGGGDPTGDGEPAPTTPQSREEAPVATTQPTDDQAIGETGGSEAPSGGGGDGPELIPAGDSEVVIDGEPVASNSLLRCEPVDSSEALGLEDVNQGEEGEALDLQVLGDGYQLFIGVSSSTAPGDIQLGNQSISIQGRAVGDGESTGVFETSVMKNGGQWFDGADQVDGPLMEWTGDRVTGSATLTDVLEAADPIEVAFDVLVPEEVQNCSL